MNTYSPKSNGLSKKQHFLHALGTLCTGGLWGIVYATKAYRKAPTAHHKKRVLVIAGALGIACTASAITSTQQHTERSEKVTADTKRQDSLWQAQWDSMPEKQKENSRTKAKTACTGEWQYMQQMLTERGKAKTEADKDVYRQLSIEASDKWKACINNENQKYLLINSTYNQ
ncbi:hypothetical protein [Endozoicomonas sp. SCSIO W0465]|uniref:hypothetical protein n=1 Tax=Endozoicomonas sp. SCSIO W0465 TaxID=2918516 RepID=UPI0020761754|nr:hypothetical protein [Endozoicomonas sp. SCSIO W0465]USE39538.1 hypothetical protein MJO57_16050 [Endozoicomonas sp. SCSIO W0465]